ncbi:phage holin family protein [Allofranklinella schreckenbergeri]|uniref:Phage holin family protein n=1 Tax=Allofranklinella schreckenbergeri TaxID=1076744 RepID=A0A3M6Q0T0_9BURK|nr:phage holin family protein [Allofranklinella schreckenbergeri]RMW96873.1 phage holin family protein [Allofranklinella schreckenbergeri]RRD40545.1 phage holin family protein [Comamonadaceae bacterium OH3737_COT-264]
MALDWQSLLGVQRLRESARLWLDEGSLAVGDRLDLARLEWQRQKSATVLLLAASALLLLFFFGAFFVGSMIVLLHYWQTPQWGTAWLGVLGVWLAIMAVAGLIAWRAWRRMGSPFALTRRVLAEDFHALREHL